MNVLLLFSLSFAIGFQAGALLLATNLILTEREKEPAPIPAPDPRMFPSYQRYLLQTKGD
jgi:hypothetical protein